MLEPGMQLSRPVVAKDSGIYPAGTFANVAVIEKLKQSGIETVNIITPGGGDRYAEEWVSELIREFNDVKEATLAIKSDFIDKVALGDTPKAAETEKTLTIIMNDLIADPDILFKLAGMRMMDNYLYAHAVNTAVLALLIGMKHGLANFELEELGAAALMADIGMTVIPPSVYSHDGPLTPEDRKVVSDHADLGAAILKKNPDTKESIINAVYSHHERMDGGGYPEGVKGNMISLFGRIVAVADVYAAIREPRAHREQSPPRRALKALTADRGFDPAILRTVLSTLSIFPVQSIIRLNNNYTGTVVGVTENNPFRPIIKLTKDAAGNNIEPLRIDLAYPNNYSLFIEEVIDILSE